MSEDNHSISLDMLKSQLAAMENNLGEALTKRRQAARHLRDHLTHGADPVATTLLTSLNALAGMSEDEQRKALHVWPTTFPDDMAACGLNKVYVSGSEPIRIWDQARAIFGHTVSMHFDNDPREVLTNCMEQDQCVGVVGWMTLAGSGQWWPVLNESRYHDLRIVGAWPVTGQTQPYAAIIAKGPLNIDIGASTLMIAHDDHHKVERIFADFELPVYEFGRARSLVLFEIPERVRAEDPRLKAAKASGLDGLRIVGALPRYNQPGA